MPYTKKSKGGIPAGNRTDERRAVKKFWEMEKRGNGLVRPGSGGGLMRPGSGGGLMRPGSGGAAMKRQTILDRLDEKAGMFDRDFRYSMEGEKSRRPQTLVDRYDEHYGMEKYEKRKGGFLPLLSILPMIVSAGKALLGKGGAIDYKTASNAIYGYLKLAYKLTNIKDVKEKIRAEYGVRTVSPSVLLRAFSEARDKTQNKHRKKQAQEIAQYDFLKSEWEDAQENPVARKEMSEIKKSDLEARKREAKAKERRKAIKKREKEEALKYAIELSSMPEFDNPYEAIRRAKTKAEYDRAKQQIMREQERLRREYEES